MRAIRFDKTGSPDVLIVKDVPPPTPGPGEILIRHSAIGVNFIDTYHRSGLYPLPLPSGIGLEGAGLVVGVGKGVTRFKPGHRAGYCTGPIGSYAELHVIPEDRAVHIPDTVELDVAAAAMLKGMTARYLLVRTFPVKPGDTILVHAAAGGVGQILVQWGKTLGARVIAVSGSDEKAKLASSLGADHSLVLDIASLRNTVRKLTNGRGVDVVYDSVGKDTFMASLDCLRPLGTMVSYGNASGPPPAIEVGLLSAKGSLFLTRPTLFHYTATPALLQETADDLFDVIGSGAVRIAEPTPYALSEAAQAHLDLEARRTTGSLVLTP
jgi:NADPH2:quinone reductase